jgi:hypothetical protein
MTSQDLAADDVIDALDSFYCHNVIVALWCDAVANRLEGPAIYLLSDEIPEVAEHARDAAARLAERIGDLGGAITADPRQFIDRAPGSYEFTIPDCSDPRAITTYAGTMLFESPEPEPGLHVSWMEPEGPHSVENIDSRRYHAIRVELI